MVTTVTTVKPVTDLAKIEQDSVEISETANQVYTNLVDEAAEAVRNLNEKSIRVYHRLGEMTYNLINSDINVYGGRTVNQFADDLHRLTHVTGVGTSTLYKASRFYDACRSQADLKLLVENGFSWRNIIALYANSEVKHSMRRDIIDRVISGSIDQTKIIPALKLRMASTHGVAVRAPVAWVKRVTKTASDYRNMLSNIDVNVIKLKGLPVADQKSQQGTITAAAREIDALIFALGEAKKSLESLVTP